MKDFDESQPLSPGSLVLHWHLPPVGFVGVTHTCQPCTDNKAVFSVLHTERKQCHSQTGAALTHELYAVLVSVNLRLFDWPPLTCLPGELAEPHYYLHETEKGLRLSAVLRSSGLTAPQRKNLHVTYRQKTPHIYLLCAVLYLGSVLCLRLHFFPAWILLHKSYILRARSSFPRIFL